MKTRQFVAYFRVSTDKQGKSGLGLDAQRAAVDNFLQSRDKELIAEFTEIESGKKDDRPSLANALTTCRIHNATLVVAKLDRLARNVSFISRLMDSGVDFIATDMPEANRLTIHIIAAMAEYEREQISNRTKAALKAAKARGVKLGNPHNATKEGRKKGIQASREARTKKARAKAADLMPIIENIRESGIMSTTGIARILNERGVPTARGGKWQAVQVKRVLEKAG